MYSVVFRQNLLYRFMHMLYFDDVGDVPTINLGYSGWYVLYVFKRDYCINLNVAVHEVITLSCRPLFLPYFYE